jgi:hypothetical protein
MSLRSAVGFSTMLDGRDAVARAFHEAYSVLEGETVDLALIFASPEYDPHRLIAGFSASAGAVPMLGFSTIGQISAQGVHPRAVGIALLAGENLEARAEWSGGFAENPARAMERVLASLGNTDGDGLLLAVADGLSGGGDLLSEGLPDGNFVLAGGLAGGDVRSGRSSQFTTEAGGLGGFAAAFVSGLRSGVGLAHGWEPVGAHFQVASRNSLWISTLNDYPVTDVYADLFGRNSRDWRNPPLRDLVRLYPLGLEHAAQGDLLVRAPLMVEQDGSLRMSAGVPDGATGHLLVGSVDGCVAAAQHATELALAGLGGIPPRLALVLADVSWSMLMKSRPGADIAAVRSVIGDVPLAGGYVLGQLAHTPEGGETQLLNQHIQVVLLG